jgi:hypothetical protein
MNEGSSAVNIVAAPNPQHFSMPLENPLENFQQQWPPSSATGAAQIPPQDLFSLYQKQHDGAIPQDFSLCVASTEEYRKERFQQKARTLPPTDYEGYLPRITRKTESVFW